jgi:hypothetical protein
MTVNVWCRVFCTVDGVQEAEPRVFVCPSHTSFTTSLIHPLSRDITVEKRAGPSALRLHTEDGYKFAAALCSPATFQSKWESKPDSTLSLNLRATITVSVAPPAPPAPPAPVSSDEKQPTVQQALLRALDGSVLTVAQSAGYTYWRQHVFGTGRCSFCESSSCCTGFAHFAEKHPKVSRATHTTPTTRTTHTHKKKNVCIH